MFDQVFGGLLLGALSVCLIFFGIPIFFVLFVDTLGVGLTLFCLMLVVILIFLFCYWVRKKTDA